MRIPEGAKRGEFNVLCTLVTRVAEFADREYQTKVWINGEGTDVTSYTEAMLDVLEDADEVYGDLGLRYGLTREQVEALERFRDRLARFQNKVSSTAWDGDDLRIVTDPEWPEVVLIASQANELCEGWRKENCTAGGLALLNFELDE
jgi:hypothetical protein